MRGGGYPQGGPGYNQGGYNQGYPQGYDPNYANRPNYVDRNNPQIAVLPDNHDNDTRRSQYDKMIAQSRGSILPGEPQGVPGYPYPKVEPDYGMKGYHHAGLGNSNLVPVGMSAPEMPMGDPNADARSYTQVGSVAHPSTSNYQNAAYGTHSAHMSGRSRVNFNQRMNQDNINADANVLEAFNIVPQDLFEYWSIYFNDAAPEYHPENVQQSMIISFLDGVLRDHRRFGNTIPYIRWNKIGSVLSEVEAFVEVRTRGQSSYDDYGAYDEKLWKLFNFLEEYPEDIINALGLILHIYRVKVLNEKESRVYPRIVTTLPDNRKENDSTRTNRFTQIRGTIICISPPKPLLRSMVFTCVECGHSVRKHFKGGYYLPPESCEDKRCPSKNFSSDRSTASLGVMQRFLVQEISSKKDSGTTAEQLSPPIIIEAIDNLVGTAHLNKAALISGIWRVDQSGSNMQKKSSKMYDHYIEANSIDYMQEPAEQISLQPEQEQAVFRKIQDCQLRFYTLIGSFCPEVPGQELVKTAIILSIVGGSHPGLLNPKQDPEAKHIKYLEANFKNRCHLLLLGERCFDKSAMLKYVESLSPNSKLLRDSRQLF